MLGVEIAAAVSLVVHCGPATPAGSAVPDISPDGLEVAYTIPREESAEIEVARPGTVSPRTRWLTLDSAPEKLVWSARGRVLAFQKRTGAIEVLSFGRRSSSRELVHVEHGTTTELGDWAPDGRQLVFARDGHIHTLDVATGDVRYLTDGLHPTWAPDGLLVAYAAGKELREISPDGGPPRTIASAIARWRRSPGRRTRHGSPSSAACSGSSRASVGVLLTPSQQSRPSPGGRTGS